MSMLSRFRKPGGFMQLLALIESCDPTKQKNLLGLVGAEDPGWAHLLKTKALSLDRILSWPTEVLMEITVVLPDRVLAMAYKAMNEGEQQDRWLSSLSDFKAKEIQELAGNIETSVNEEHAAVIKIIQTVRELEANGKLKFAKFAPELVVDPRIAA